MTTHSIQRLLAASVLGLALTAQAQPQVPVMPAQARAVTSGFELDGVIQPVKQATVSTQASGRIATLLVKAGERVKAGQLLATVDDRETQTGVQRSAAQLSQADAELRNARSNVERTRELQSKGFVSQAALDGAESQFKAAQAGRDQAQAGTQQSALAQGFTRVTAPFEGWVQQTLAEAGDLAVPGKPLLTLYAPLPIRAVVQVPASRAEAARTASSIEVQIGEGPAGRWVKPTSRAALPLADAVAQTIEWRLELPQDAVAGLVPGQQLRVRFVGAQVQSRSLVPSSALLRRGELTAVYVVSGQGFVLKAVRLGADHGASGVEVVAGLAANDQVALDPVQAGLAGAKPLSTPAVSR
jgi:RND family efflux transporter MFP subunit